MDWIEGEPTLDETLADPIVGALLRRDGVDQEYLRRLLRDVSQRLNSKSRYDAWCETVRDHAA